MGSDTAITKAEARLRAFARSRIAHSIFFWNFVGLGILLLGVLLLSEMRAGLTEAQYRNLRTQGELIANLLVETNAVAGEPLPGVNEPGVREVLRRLLPPIAEGARTGSGPRVRVFLPAGSTVADTDVLYDQLEQTPLPPIGKAADIGRSIDQFAEKAGYFRLTPWRPTITLNEERRRALLGEISWGERLNERGVRVVSVTLPVRRVQAVQAIITLESADVERLLLAERVAMLPFVIGASLVIFLSSLLLTVVIAEPLRHLAAAADRLRVSGATRLQVPESKRKDEIGALAHSLEAMTGALADRIDANERFAADVSHEIKNPLASIRSAIDAARAVPDPERQAKLLGIVAQDVKRLDRLVTDIARASRIEAETARLDLTAIDLGSMLSDLSRAYSPDEDSRDEHAIPVVFKGLPPQDAIVMGQEGPLGQVFRNLIDNARSFSPPDGVVVLSVDIARGKSGQVVRAVVQDQGPGIPPDNLETVFQRFYTERPKGVEFGGNSGLGLSIARQIVEALDGRIYAENVAGERAGQIVGARLIVELPLAGPETA